MRYKLVLALLLIAHLLGDYYLQPQKLAAAKGKRRGALLLHCLLYGAAMAAICLPFTSFPQAWWVLLVPVSHAAIDYLKNALLKTKALSGEKQGRILFFIDQFSHLLLMILFAVLFEKKADANISALGAWFFHQFEALNVGITGTQFIGLGILLLFLGKPCNVIVRNLLPPRETEEIKSENAQKAGRIIGILERCLIAIFILLNQWGTLGFVLAAKTLTRFNKIAEDKEFAEQYLIGTMSSILLTVLAVLVYKLF